MSKLALFLGGFLLLTIMIGLLGTIPPSWWHDHFPFQPAGFPVPRRACRLRRIPALSPVSLQARR